MVGFDAHQDVCVGFCHGGNGFGVVSEVLALGLGKVQGKARKFVLNMRSGEALMHRNIAGFDVVEQLIGSPLFLTYLLNRGHQIIKIDR